jgi:hypothetical protein
MLGPVLVVCTAELFPTVAPNAEHGCSAQPAQMGAAVPLLLVVVGERPRGVPFAVFGALVIAGMLVLFASSTAMESACCKIAFV